MAVDGFAFFRQFAEQFTLAEEQAVQAGLQGSLLVERINALMKDIRGGILTRDDELHILDLLQGREMEALGAKIDSACARAKREGFLEPEALKLRVKAILADVCGRPLDEAEEGSIDLVIESESPEFQADLYERLSDPDKIAETKESLRRTFERLDIEASLRQQQYRAYQQRA